LGEVREAIEYHLRQQKTQALREQFSEAVQAGLAIQIHRATLDALPEHRSPDTSGPPTLPP